METLLTLLILKSTSPKFSLLKEKEKLNKFCLLPTKIIKKFFGQIPKLKTLWEYSAKDFSLNSCTLKTKLKD